MPNKVTFGIKNVHYATFTEVDGVYSYDTPKPLPGAVRIGLDPLGETIEFYADDVLYYSGAQNSGYQGPFECAHVTDEFRQDVFGDEISANGLLTENVNAVPRHVALLFQFEGDVRKTRVCLYNCSIARPSIATETNTNTKNVNTPSMQITASPRADGLVRALSTDDTDADVYDRWFESVPEPGASDLPALSALAIGSLTLTPTFDPAVTQYAAATTNSTNAITATAEDADAGIIIAVNGNSIASGGSATWDEGENQVVISVTQGGATNTYRVTVTKS